ncbi:MAG: hypothetical protein ACI90V_009880, partial [Bacillariaceae sp.]
ADFRAKLVFLKLTEGPAVPTLLTP